MKELIRSLRLRKLSNTPLTSELKRLDNAINFIQKILDKMVLKIDPKEYPLMEFYFIDDKTYFEYDIETTDLWCRHDKLWKRLESKYRYNYYEISYLIKNIVEEHFKNKIVTPSNVHLGYHVSVEEYFKNRTVTPQLPTNYTSIKVETHFKKKKAYHIRQIFD